MGEGKELIIRTRLDVDYADAQAQLDELENKINEKVKDKEIKVKLNFEGDKDLSAGIKELNDNIKALTDKAKELITMLMDQNKAAVTAAAPAAGRSSGNSPVGVAAANNRGAAKSAKTMSGLKTAIGSLARRLSIFVLIAKAVGDLIHYLRNILTWNMEFRRAMADLKGAIFTIAQPIVEFLIPMVIKLTQVLSKLLARLARLVATAFGKSLEEMANNAARTWYYVDSIQRTIASYDELNVITTNGILPDFSNIVDNANDVGIFENAFASLEGVLKALLEFGQAVYPILKRLWDELLYPILTFILDKVVPHINKVTEHAIREITSVVKGEKSLIKAIFNILGYSIADTAGLVMEGILEIDWGKVLEYIKSKMKVVADYINDTFGGGNYDFNFLNVMKGLFKMFFIDIPGLFLNVETGMFNDACTGFYEGLKQGIEDQDWETIKSDIKSVATDISGVLSESLSDVNENVITPFLDDIMQHPLANAVVNAINFFFRQSDDSVKRESPAFIKTLTSVKDTILTVLGVLTNPLLLLDTSYVKKFFKALGEEYDDGLKDLEKEVKDSGAILRTDQDTENLVIKKSPLLNTDQDTENLVLKKVTKNIGDFSYSRMATGGVVPPNREFLALLGDNKTETEVVSPLSTIKEAVREELMELSAGNRQPIVLQLDGKTVAKVVWDEQKKAYKQNGTYAPYV